MAEVQETNQVSDELLEEMYEAMRRHTREGDPVKAYAVQDHITNRTKPPSELLYFGEVRPAGGIGDGIAPPDMPRRAGKGASRLAWQQFAKQTSDLEHEIIDAMDRDTVIKALEAQGIIPREEKSDFYDEN